MKINHVYIKDKKRFFFSFVWVSASTNQPCWNIEFSFTYLYTTSNNTIQYTPGLYWIWNGVENLIKYNYILFSPVLHERRNTIATYIFHHSNLSFLRFMYIAHGHMLIFLCSHLKSLNKQTNKDNLT
jgi:hypothetical protein